MSGASAGSGGGKKRVLVVEDEADVRKMIVRMLSAFAEVDSAADGVEALAKMQAGAIPDLLITDVMMPQMDGLTLVRKLKGDPKLARVPVLMLTAKSGPRDTVAGINAGARHYLTKPFKHEELLDKVKKALGQAR
jgi:CheY-like chemotaxis protein